jgi:predicted dehydrogenase
MSNVGVGIIGSQFVAEIHAEALKGVSGADLIAVASPTEQNVRSFAVKHDVDWFLDYQELLLMDEIDAVILCLPNYLHCSAALAAVEAGKHLICEKPLCMNLHWGMSTW